MKRLPRKRKKEAKKIVAAKTAIKVTLSAMTAAQAMMQNAMIASMPVLEYTPATLADKAVSVAKNLVSASKAIGKIMSEPPNTWRDFIK